jgi:type I restriction-modification system DNA methylase subunit
MALFLPIVLEKELKNLDDAKVRAAFETLKNNFSFETQKLILQSIEIALQGEFVELFFDDVLGYTRFPRLPWHIKREQNSAESNERADAAIAKNSDDEHIIAVVELKGTDTHDLKSVEQQVFKYFKQHPNCRYAIASNYQSIRLYIDDNQGYEEFNIFDLVNNDDYERFRLLYCYLNKDAVLGDTTQKLRELTIIKEKEVTASLYLWYKQFRVKLFDDLKASNKAIDTFVLYQKTQKLLDRFLFILFAEDKDLLPRFTIKTNINNWIAAGRKGTLLQVFQALFQELNTGNKAKNIFAYNGGLFAPDAVIDSLKLPIGNTLEIYLLELEAYDYKTQVDVSILGHIFEQSLNDLDEMKALAAGEPLDKPKKDGVFYTPQYITRYIIENTLGALCNEKRQALGIVAGKKTTETALLTYQEWLNTITVLDPACGSGAFLSEVLTFFVREHEAVEERIAGTTGKPVIYKDRALDILAHNIFGVDLNAEAVEIAKLSLWLRTAKQGRKLSDLAQNIKTGNSLIDDPTITDKPFNWKREFPNVFKNGGFDVVVGNPPYGAKVDAATTNYLATRFAEYGISKRLTDTYFIFNAFCANELLKKEGYLGFITPNTWRLISAASDFRAFMFQKFNFIEILQHAEKVFPDATVDCDTFILKKHFNMHHKVRVLKKRYDNIEAFSLVTQKDFITSTSINTEVNKAQLDLSQKIHLKSVIVKDILEIKNGVKPYEVGKGRPAQTRKILDEKPFTLNYKKDKTFVPLIGGSNFHKYVNFWNNDNYISYGIWLAAARDTDLFFNKKEKLIFRQTSDKLIGTLISDGFVMRNNTHIILKIDEKYDLRYILSLLNSKLLNFIYWTINPEKGEALAEVKAFHLGMLPVYPLTQKQQVTFITLADKMLSTNEQIESLRSRFILHIQSVFEDKVALNKKLNDWQSGTWLDFVAEFRKQKFVFLPKQTVATQAEFQRVQMLIQNLQITLRNTDAEIDKKVYELYDLTPEEIEIVERG